MKERRAVVAGTGKVIGDVCFTTDQVLERMGIDRNRVTDDYSRDLIKKSYPVRMRVGDPEVRTSSLMIEASKKALKAAGIGPEKLSLVICVTDTPDQVTPATAARVQFELGAVRSGFFDLNAACSGYSSALAMASNHIRCNEEVEYVLVVGGNVYSRYIHPQDLDDQLLFSDGAGAVVLKASERADRGIQRSTLFGDGYCWDRWGVYGGGTWKGFSKEVVEGDYHLLKKVAPYDKDINIVNWPRVARETLEKTGWAPSDVNRAFVTQSRRRPIYHLCKEMGWDNSVSYNTADKYGYLGSGCIPVALDDAVENGILQAGQKLLLLTSGIGYGCSSVTLIWGE